MPRFAMMSGNSVGTIIIADDKETTEAALNCVLIELAPDNPASSGWTYDAETKIFTAPVEPTMEETDANAQ